MLTPDERKRLTALTGAAKRAVKGGAVSTNRLLARLRHIFTWAISKGFVKNTPFKREGVIAVTMDTNAETERIRRLAGNEEGRLLAAAGPHLQALIVAALETGCRLGELLTMQLGAGPPQQPGGAEGAGATTSEDQDP